MGFAVTTDGQDPSGPTAIGVPQPAPVVNPQFKPQTTVNVSGGSGGSSGSSIGSGIGSIAGTAVAGPIGGAVGGFLGDIFGGLFAKGGLVSDGYAYGGSVKKSKGYADGGSVNAGAYNQGLEPPGMANGDDDQSMPPPDDKNNWLALGYLVGAYHQNEYGGTPDTLGDAANKIKSMLNKDGSYGESNNLEPPPMGYAEGGAIDPLKNDQSLAYEALLHSLGMDPNRQIEKGYAKGGNVSGNANDYNGPDKALYQQELQEALGTHNNIEYQNQNQVPPTSVPQTQQQVLPLGTQNSMASGNPNQLRGYAKGGPSEAPMMSDDDGDEMNTSDGSELNAGEAFNGDGEVNGPGTPTSDSIPAKLSDGEFVFSQPAVQFFGVDKLNRMNEQGKQGYMQMVAQVQANQAPKGAQGLAQGGPPVPNGQPQGNPGMQPLNMPQNGMPMRPPVGMGGPMAPPQGQPMAPPQGISMRTPAMQPQGRSNVPRAKNSGYFGA